MAVFGDPEAMRYIGDGSVRTLDQVRESFKKRLDQLLRAGHTMWTVIERDSDEIIGDCGVFPIAWTGPELELGYRFRTSAWGRGFATEAGRAALEHFLSLKTDDELIAVTDPRNDASGRVLRKLGFTDAGLTDAYYGTTTRLYCFG